MENLLSKTSSVPFRFWVVNGYAEVDTLVV